MPLGNAGVNPVAFNGGSQLSLSPNPAGSHVAIQYSLSTGGPVELTIFDEQGNTVRQLVNEYESAGSRELSVPLDGLASGHYFVRLSISDEVLSRELLVVRS